MEQAPDDSFVGPLVGGMAGEFEGDNLGTFIDRMTALSKITGQSYWPPPKKGKPGWWNFTDNERRKYRQACDNALRIHRG